MPLLKKYLKGSMSQTSNSKFKIPYIQHKHRIKDLVDENTVHDPQIKKLNNAFTESLSPEKFINRSSLPKARTLSHGNKKTEIQKTALEKCNEYKFDRKGGKREFSFNSEDSLSQEDLNKPNIKAAYIEFMQKKENGIQQNFVRRQNSPMNMWEECEPLFQNDLSKTDLDHTLYIKNKNNTLQTQDQPFSEKGTTKTKRKSKDNSGRIVRRYSKNKLKSSEDGTTDDELFELSQEILANHSLLCSNNKVNNEERNSQLQTEPTYKEKKEKNKSKQAPAKGSNESESTNSFSQEKLNNGKVKTAYVEFMNKSLAKENKAKKKRDFIMYSSSEDLFNEFEMSFQSNKSREDSVKSSLKKRKKDSTSEKFAKRSKNEKSKSSEKMSQTNKKLKKKTQGNMKNREDSNEEFSGLTLEEKMVEIYKKRNVGLFVLCDSCDKARFLPHTVDPLDLPDKWYCHMNPEKTHNKCTDPEIIEENKEFLIDNLYNAGSIVFAKMDGFPWWPAMVEDDPDTESYFWLEGESMKPTYYHTTFFDSSDVTRAWIRTPMIKPFKKNIDKAEFLIPKKSRYRSRLTAAYKQADDASSIPLLDRLMKYGFIKRYKKRANEKKSKKVKRNKKNKAMSPHQDESGFLSDLNLSDISFSFMD